MRCGVGATRVLLLAITLDFLKMQVARIIICYNYTAAAAGATRTTAAPPCYFGLDACIGKSNTKGKIGYSNVRLHILYCIK